MGSIPRPPTAGARSSYSGRTVKRQDDDHLVGRPGVPGRPNLSEWTDPLQRIIAPTTGFNV